VRSRERGVLLFERVVARPRLIARFEHASRLRRTPSIQPTRRASSTDSAHVTLRVPVPTLWKPTRSSSAVAWCCSNHARSFAGVAKKRGRGAIRVR
jgi:hypothetical protein